MLLYKCLSPLFTDNLVDKEVWPAVMSLPQWVTNKQKQRPVSILLPSVLASFLSSHRNSSQVVQSAPPVQLLSQTDRDGGWDMEELGGGRREEKTKATLGFCVMFSHGGDRGPRWYNPIEPLYKNLLPWTPTVSAATFYLSLGCEKKNYDLKVCKMLGHFDVEKSVYMQMICWKSFFQFICGAFKCFHFSFWQKKSK